MDKEKIKEQANIDIFNLHKAQEQGVITEFGKGKLEALEGIVDFIDSMQKEPVSEEMEEAAFDYAEACKCDGGEKLLCVEHFKAGAKWQKKHLWKSAEGPDLPIFDREVIALKGIVDPTATDCLCGYEVIFAHRPDTKGYDGKSITTGETKHYTPKTYGEGGWNIPNIVYWLDVELPKEIEL